jgi:hypothetical protein
MHWLRKQGGHCKSGIAADEIIGMVPVTKLISPVGKHVIHHGGDQSEELSALMIDYYDRRLQMISPFRSLPLGGN